MSDNGAHSPRAGRAGRVRAKKTLDEATRTRRLIEPWRIFFPSALLLAPGNVLLWLAARDGVIDPAGIGSAAWHGREMLFGYSFAVMAGYLLRPMPVPALALLWLAWLTGRLLWLLPAGVLPAGVELALAVVFPAVLALLGALRFAAVKRPRNLPFPLIMLALGLAAAGTFAVQLGLLSYPRLSPVILAAYLVSLLIMMMGGRLVPTATVGALRARGRYVRIPSQPYLEAATLACVLALVASEGFIGPTAAGATALAACVVLLLQMSRWRGAGTLHDPEVWPLHLGFFWLALGCALIGLERLGVLVLPDAGALHALTAGGIGTVTLVMMTRVTRYRAGGAAFPTAMMQGLQLLMALAVTIRVTGGWAFAGHRTEMLWLSAAAWTVAYTGSAVLLLPAALRARAGSSTA